jgi:hypothetical protein
MDTETFLRTALGDEGYYCVFAYKQKNVIQKFYSEIQEVIDEAQDLDAHGYNTFYALGTFITSQNREADNVQQMRSLFLDIDCGKLSEKEQQRGVKKYLTQNEALTALKRFCRETGLPKPTIVNSGGGLHVYWFLSTPVDREHWLPVAKRLKVVAAEHELYIDNSVTADAARILRVPLTRNHKYEDPKPVRVLNDTLTAPLSLENYIDILGAGEGFLTEVKDTVPMGYSAVQTALMGNYESSFKDILQRTMKGDGCQQLGIIATQQETCSEPLWRAGLSIAKFCSDGQKAAHRISSKHPDYSEEETNQKLDQIKGPYRCETFDSENPDVCTECPHWGKVGSPISLGRRVKEAIDEDNIIHVADITAPSGTTNKYVIPQYPHPYFRGANGGIYVRVPDGQDGFVDEMIYHNDLYVVNRLHDMDQGEMIVMRLHLPHDGIREFTVPFTAVTSKEELRKQLSAQGVATLHMDKLMKYTMTWVNELQAAEVAHQARRQFGWSEDHTSFTLGNKQIYANKVETNPASTKTAGWMPHFKPKGTLEEWKETINFYNQDNLALHQFVVCRAFGSVLLEFFEGISSSLFHINGGTGIGKTTAMQAMLSVWGNPDKLMAREEDTYNAKMNRYEVFKNLPICMDEMTNTSPKALSALIYQITAGRQKDRMEQSANKNRTLGEPWKSTGCSAANMSIVDRITIGKADAGAELQRLLEYKEVRQYFDTDGKEKTDAFTVRLLRNYGHAGVVYIQYLLNHLQEVEDTLYEIRKRVDRAADLSSMNRYWSADVTCTVAGCHFARKAGLISFNTKNIFEFGLKVIEENKGYEAALKLDISQLITEYISEQYNNILWIKSTFDLRKQNSEEDTQEFLQHNGLDAMLVEPMKNPRIKLVGRYETDKKRAFLIPKYMKEWCVERQLDYSSLMQDLKETLGAKKIRTRITKGTHMDLLSDVVVFTLNYNASDEED